MTNLLYLTFNIVCQNSECLGRKISYEKSATAFSLKLGRRRNEVIQEFDAFCSNVGVDPTRYSILESKLAKKSQKLAKIASKHPDFFSKQDLSLSSSDDFFHLNFTILTK